MNLMQNIRKNLGRLFGFSEESTKVSATEPSLPTACDAKVADASTAGTPTLQNKMSDFKSHP
jgi:hypothetical protein